MTEPAPRTPLEPYERLILIQRCQSNPQVKPLLARIEAGGQAWRDEVPPGLYQWVQDKFAELRAAAALMPRRPAPRKDAARKKAKEEAAQSAKAEKVNKQAFKG